MSITFDDCVIGLADGRSVGCWTHKQTQPLWKIGSKDNLLLDRMDASRDGRYVLTSFRRSFACLNRIIENVPDERSIRLDGHGSPIDLVAMSPTGLFAAAASVSGQIVVWKIPQDLFKPSRSASEIENELQSCRSWRQSHGGLLKSIAVDDQGRVYSASEDKHLCFWSSQERSMLEHWRSAPDSNISISTLSSDGEFVFLGADNGSVQMRSLDQQQAVDLLPASNHAITQMQWSKDGGRLAVADAGGRVSVINVPQPYVAQSSTYASLQLPECDAHRSINELEFSDDGILIAVCQGRYVISVLEFSDATEAHEEFKLQLVDSIKLKRSAFAMVWNQNDTLITCGDSIRKWKLGEEREIEIGSGTRNVQCAVLDRFRNRLLVGVGDGRMRIYDLSGNLIDSSPSWLMENSSQDQFRNIALITLSPNGETILTGSTNGDVAIWDAENLSYIGTLPIGVANTDVAALRISEQQQQLWVHWSRSAGSRFHKETPSTSMGQSLRLAIAP